MYLLWSILTTSMTWSIGTTKFRDTSDAPSEIISTLAFASFTAENTSPETPRFSRRLSPTAQTRATPLLTSILSMSLPSSPFSCLRVVFTSLLLTRKATVEREVDIE